MGALVDITGNRYGRLVVLQRAPNKNGRMRWFCQCDCGQTAEVRGEHLKNLDIQSCGCIHVARVTTHGKSHSREYSSWQAMKWRCLYPESEEYYLYGGRGITVCKRWINSFANFYADMGERPPGTSLDRKDFNGNYTPKNCRWATKEDQVYNRRNSRFATIGGITKPVKQWCAEIGTDYQTALKRMKRGVPPEIACTTKGHALRGTVHHADWK